MAGRYNFAGRLDEHDSALARVERDLDTASGEIRALRAQLAALQRNVTTTTSRVDAELIQLSQEVGAHGTHLAQIDDRISTLHPKPPRPDVSEYVDAMRLLVNQHEGDWYTIASTRDASSTAGLNQHDKIRYVIDGLTNLADASSDTGMIGLAVALCRRVAEVYTPSTGETWTADTRLAAGFGRVAEVARRLGVDGGVAEVHRRRVYADNAHAEVRRLLELDVYQGQCGAMARLARGVDDDAAYAFVNRWLSEWTRRGRTYGAGFEDDDRYAGGRPLWRSGREFAWLGIDRDGMALGIWGEIWARCAQQRDGKTFFASHIDGHVQATISASDSRPWHGAVRLTDGLCLLPEARPYVRAVLGMPGPALADLMVPGAVAFMRALNCSDPDDGHRECALIGGAAMAEVLAA